MQVMFKSADGHEFSSALDCLKYESKPPVSLLSRITQMKRDVLPSLHNNYLETRSVYRAIDSSYTSSEVRAILDRLYVARGALRTGITFYRSLRAQLKDFNSARHSNPLLARMHREVQLALSRCESTPDLARSIYDSALGAYAAVLQGDHSGYSWEVTRSVVDRMLKELALTPVLDEDFVDVKGEEPVTTFRQSGIYKRLKHDGSITYTDHKRVVGVDIDTGGHFTSSLIREVVDEMFPIEMPYYTPGTPYRVYVRTYCDKGFPDDHHDFNREWLSHVVTPSGECVTINRTWVHESGILIEITDDKDELSKRGECHKEDGEKEG